MIIYKTINLINGKQYVGQDSKNNPNYYGSGELLKKAVKRYGKENFRKKILEYCSTKEKLDERESYWIGRLNTKVPNGYNLADGGGGILGYIFTEKQKQNLSKIKKGHIPWNKGIPHSESTKVKMGEAHKGLIHSEESKRKMSKAKKGDKNPKYWKGKNLSEEHRRTLSEVHADVSGEKHPGAKLKELDIPIIRRLIEESNLIQRQIAEHFDVDPSTISNIKTRKTWKHV